MTLGVWDEVSFDDEQDIYTQQVNAREERIKNYVGTRAIVPTSPVKNHILGSIRKYYAIEKQGTEVRLFWVVDIQHPHQLNPGYRRKHLVGTFQLFSRNAEIVHPKLFARLEQPTRSLGFTARQIQMGEGFSITPLGDAGLTWLGDNPCPITINPNPNPARVIEPKVEELDLSTAKVDGKPVTFGNQTKRKGFPVFPSALPRESAIAVISEERIGKERWKCLGYLLLGRVGTVGNNTNDEAYYDWQTKSATIGGKTPNCWHFVGNGKFTL